MGVSLEFKMSCFYMSFSRLNAIQGAHYQDLIGTFQGDAAKMEPMVGVGKRLSEMLLKKRETVR